jgi:ATP-dependent RNA helicase DeaD
VHRIGRTGRAGRSGEAILFVAPRERNMLRAIERATRQPIEPMQLPSIDTVNDRRVAKFKDRIAVALAADGLAVFRNVIEQYEREHNVPAIEIAAALARLAQGDKSLLLDQAPKGERREFVPDERSPRKAHAEKGYAEREQRRTAAPGNRDKRPETSPPFAKRNAPAETFTKREKPATPFAPPAQRAELPEGLKGATPRDGEKPPRKPRDDSPREAPRARSGEAGMETFRVEVGHVHGVKPNNLVGAIANEAGLDSKHIGRISIQDDYSLIDLPEGMPTELLGHLKKVWVAGQRLRISRDNGEALPSEREFAPRAKGKPPGKGKKPFKRA